MIGDSARPNPNDPRPYPRVITRDAKTRVGMFKTHIIGDRLYFEIPRQELNRDMLMVGRVQKSRRDARRLRRLWRRPVHGACSQVGAIGNRVILRSPSFAITADSTLPVASAVLGVEQPRSGRDLSGSKRTDRTALR